MEELLLKEILERAWENESFSLVALVVIQGLMLFRQRSNSKILKQIVKNQDTQNKIMSKLSLDVNANTVYREKYASKP